jgi:hypothetical protein
MKVSFRKADVHAAYGRCSGEDYGEAIRGGPWHNAAQQLHGRLTFRGIHTTDIKKGRLSLQWSKMYLQNLGDIFLGQLVSNLGI